ncbi:MAG: hypothetical protein HY549_12230 [Elusimicrobia bacterium]|nr:hypothetical protein [Elusimicrobiota bacterium]
MSGPGAVVVHPAWAPRRAGRAIGLGVWLWAVAYPAQAAFESSAQSPRDLALAGALTAVGGDPVALFSNPASLGSLRSPAVGTHYLRLFRTSVGEVNEERMSFVGGLPLFRDSMNGAAAFSHVYTEPQGGAAEKASNFSYGSRGLYELENGVVDSGASLKWLKRGGAAGKAALDLGVGGRFRDHLRVGLAVLNLNRPMFGEGSEKSRAPITLKLGVAEQLRGFLFAMDLTKSEPSGARGSVLRLATGLERWWPTPRWGSIAGRVGLSLGNRDKSFSWGAAWKMMGGEFDYAMGAPMTGATRFSHAIALSYRFGQSDPEMEYEKVLAEEMRTRRDLTKALESAELRQWKLAEELKALRAQTEELRSRLADKAASESETREKMKILQERQRQAAEELKRVQAESQKLAEKSQSSLFQQDWAAYNKFKLEGAADSVLEDQVRRLLRKYKDEGVDLSEPNQELMRLLKAR